MRACARVLATGKNTPKNTNVCVNLKKKKETATKRFGILLNVC